jgi:glycosyltransferase involved in cell wall biosynthesis
VTSGSEPSTPASRTTRGISIRVDIVDPSAFTMPYDHALAGALARAGAEVRLITSAFAYGDVPEPDGYERRQEFYRGARGAPGSRLRLASKLAVHGRDMLRLRRLVHQADIVHFQWLAVPSIDRQVLPTRPMVLTAHDLLPREPRPGQLRAHRRLLEQMEAIVVHSVYGQRTLVEGTGIDAAKVHVIHHGAFAHLAELEPGPLPPELPQTDRPVVLCFGLLRPYKGIEVLLDAWRGISDAELWVVGRPLGVDPAVLAASAPPGVRILGRFVSDAEQAALFRAADLVVLPYLRTERFDFSGVLATALAFGRASVVSDIGGFSEVAAAGAARLVEPGDADALRAALGELLGDSGKRELLAAGARAAALGDWSWDAVARRTLELYATILRA